MIRLATYSAALSVFWTALAASAGDCRCGICGTPCHPERLVKKTICVPTVVVETRLKTCIVKSMQEREETYTAFKRVPKTTTINKETCYLDDEVRTKTITQKKCKRVKIPVTTTYAVNVPVEEYRPGVRRKEVCSDCGKVCIEEPCMCKVTRMVPDVRTKTCEREDVVFETVKKEINYCVKVPKKRTEFCREETVYKLEPVEKTRTVMCCVPEVVKKPVEVKTVKMLHKTVCCCERCHHKLAREKHREQRGDRERHLQLRDENKRHLPLRDEDKRHLPLRDADKRHLPVRDEHKRHLPLRDRTGDCAPQDQCNDGPRHLAPRDQHPLRDKLGRK